MTHSAGVIHGQADVLNGEVGTVEGEVYHKLTGDVITGQNLTLANNDGSIIMPADSEYTFLLENISFRSTVRQDNGEIFTGSWGGYGSFLSVQYVYSDGTYSDLQWFGAGDDEIAFNKAKDNHSVKLQVNEVKDISRVIISETNQLHTVFTFTDTYGYVGNVSGFVYPMKLTITEVDKNTGLLEGLLAWVKNIGENVSDSFDVINSGFANIGTWFAELPSKIWSVMENGIKGLFVPDQQYMETYSDKWEQFLLDRLGAVYQVCDITLNSWDAIIHADETNTITFPLVTIPLPDNASFSFGGYEVKIVPDGFSALATAVKTAVGILCTYLFVNGLMKRYEEVMGVKE